MVVFEDEEEGEVVDVAGPVEEEEGVLGMGGTPVVVWGGIWERCLAGMVVGLVEVGDWVMARCVVMAGYY